MSVTIEDKSNFEKLMGILKALNGRRIEFGVFKSGMILMIAIVNEYGVRISVTPKMRNFLAANGLHLKKSTSHIVIPERSYLRSGYDRNLKKIQAYIKRQFNSLFAFNISVDQFFNSVGAYCVSRIQEFMTRLNTPPNHPFTIARKRSSNPLIDTGTLRKSIEFRVV